MRGHDTANPTACYLEREEAACYLAPSHCQLCSSQQKTSCLQLNLMVSLS